MILVLNCGSTSVKYEVFDELESIAEGAVTDIGEEESGLWHSSRTGTVEETQHVADHSEALEIVMEMMTHADHGVVESIEDITAVGHRVVHGGELSEPQLVDEALKETIRKFSSVAPLHNPVNLAGMNAAEEILPDKPQVVVFDTAFHQTMPAKAYLYGLPYEFYEEYGIRKFGFHGISHEFVAREAAKLLDVPFEEAQLITCHLGGGCSMAAVRNGVSIDTTMGFSPLEGLIMATRTGDVDPTVIQFLVNEHGFDVDDVFSVLNNESGLAGLSGIGEDMRKILRAREEGNERAALAIDAFTYRIKKYIGAYTAVLDDVDGIVFTAGIGENAAPIRERSCDIPTLDVVVDKEANETTQSERAIISAAESAVPVAVIPTDEELMIARETARIVSEMS